MVVRLMPHKILAVGLSHLGLIRQNNEDVWVQLPDIDFFALADGMGGHQAGEVAAREAVNALCRTIRKKAALLKENSTLDDAAAAVKQSIAYANSFVHKMSKSDPELQGMGTTLCCLLFHEKGLVYAHVGDSRIYRMRRGMLEQLTKDDSLVRELVDQGRLNAQQASDFLYKNIITKAIGAESKLDPTVNVTETQNNDFYIMCSDGLSDLLTTEDIQTILVESPSIERAAEMLIACANERGGRDNITVVIVHFLTIL